MPPYRIYIETTIPSVYHEVRTAPEIVARRNWTRRWWDGAAKLHDLVTSAAVLNELSDGPEPNRSQWLALVGDLPLLSSDQAIVEIAETYIRHRLMPADPGGDALHLAYASFHECDFLMTWNCRHLANANKLSHIRRINTMLGLVVPALVTPLGFLGDDDDEEDK